MLRGEIVLVLIWASVIILKTNSLSSPVTVPLYMSDMLPGVLDMLPRIVSGSNTVQVADLATGMPFSYKMRA